MSKRKFETIVSKEERKKINFPRYGGENSKSKYLVNYLPSANCVRISTLTMQEKFKNYMCINATPGFDIEIEKFVMEESEYEENVILYFMEQFEKNEWDSFYLLSIKQQLFFVSIPGESLLHKKNINYVCEIRKKPIIIRIGTKAHVSIAIIYPNQKKIEVFNSSNANFRDSLSFFFLLNYIGYRLSDEWEYFMIYPNDEEEDNYDKDIVKNIQTLQIEDHFCQTWIWFYLYLRIVKKYSVACIFIFFNNLRKENEKYIFLKSFYDQLMQENKNIEINIECNFDKEYEKKVTQYVVHDWTKTIQRLSSKSSKIEPLLRNEIEKKVQKREKEFLKMLVQDQKKGKSNS